MRQRLIEERKLIKQTQKEVAHANGVTLRHYQSLEIGTSDGSIKLWLKLSKYFDKPIDYLLSEAPNDQPA